MHHPTRSVIILLGIRNRLGSRMGCNVIKGTWDLAELKRLLLARAIQLDQAHLLDLPAQELRRSPLTDHWRTCSWLTPRLAQESTAQALPSQRNRSGLEGELEDA